MVAVQIRDVPAAVRDALGAEAARRGTSLQTYLLAVLTREAGAARNRRLLLDWATTPLGGPTIMVDAVELVSDDRHERERELLRRLGTD